MGIVPFCNQTGDPALDWFGEGLAQLVADNLAGSRHLRVISGAENLIRKSAAGAEPSSAVPEWGVEFLLTGEIFRGAEGLTLAARLSQSSDGHQLSAERIEGLDPSQLLKASDRIALAVRKGLSLPLTEEVDVFAADFAASHPEAYELYIVGLRALKDILYEDAERAFSAALLKEPDFTMARYQLATALAFSGKSERAVREIRQALAESSQLPDLEARYIRAAEAWFSFREEEAIQAYRELLGLYPFETEARFWLGVVFGETRRPQEAIEEFETLTRLEPGLHVVWNSLGFRYMEIGDFGRAEMALRRFAELEPDAANPHDSLGELYRRQGRLDLAAQEYETALSLDPDFHGAAVMLGVVDVLRGRMDQAERRLLSVYSNGDAPPRRRIDAAFELTHLRRAQGRFRESAFILEAMQKTLEEEQRRQQRSLMFRGLSVMEIGKSEQAGRLIEEAVRTYHRPPTRYLFARGLLELHLGQIGRVRGTTAEILALEQPSEARKHTAKRAAHYLQGMADLAEQKAESAIELLTQAVNEPGSDYVIYRLGLARANLAAGRLEVALSEARRCAEPLNPSSSALHLELDRVRAVLLTARIYDAMGRKEQAAIQAGRFLELWEHADVGLPDLQEARRLGRQ
ncbi:MAG: tetratricopeptide repeat protein [Acidobacteriota bacterium]